MLVLSITDPCSHRLSHLPPQPSTSTHPPSPGGSVSHPDGLGDTPGTREVMGGGHSRRISARGVGDGERRGGCTEPLRDLKTLHVNIIMCYIYIAIYIQCM